LRETLARMDRLLEDSARGMDRVLLSASGRSRQGPRNDALIRQTRVITRAPILANQVNPVIFKAI
jgi:hypothetical protein